jgi:hypothetical protein
MFFSGGCDFVAVCSGENPGKGRVIPRKAEYFLSEINLKLAGISCDGRCLRAQGRSLFSFGGELGAKPETMCRRNKALETVFASIPTATRSDHV